MKKMTNNQLIECLNSGMSINDIRLKFNFANNSNIINRAKKLGLIDLAYHNSNIFEHDRSVNYNSVIELIKQGFNMHQIAEKINCSTQIVQYIAKKYNLKITPKSRILDIEFTDDEFQVLYGTVLGDTHLSHNSKNIQGSFNHCVKQKELAEFKQQYLNRFTNPVRIVKKHDKRLKIPNYDQYYCYIKASTALNAIYDKIYSNNIKYINKELLYKLDGLGIAIWYMDDGSKPKYGGYLLCTMNFSDSDLNIIQEFFKQKFDINTIIRKDKSLYIKADSKEKFKELIKPYIIPSMMYKL